MTHDLKCWPEFFENLAAGRKTFECRIDDRNYRLGDELLIREWSPVTRQYTGREERRTVSHLLRNWRGVASGYVVLSLATDAMGSVPAAIAEAKARLAGYTRGQWTDKYAAQLLADSIRALIEPPEVYDLGKMDEIARDSFSVKTGAKPE